MYPIYSMISNKRVLTVNSHARAMFIVTLVPWLFFYE
jgi:hypothetical protein